LYTHDIVSGFYNLNSQKIEKYLAFIYNTKIKRKKPLTFIVKDFLCGLDGTKKHYFSISQIFPKPLETPIKKGV